MNESMVTGRMNSEKKALGNRVLERNGLNASQAINLLYDQLVSTNSTSFLQHEPTLEDGMKWKSAAAFVDSIGASFKHEQISGKYLNMSDAEIRAERLKKRGLM